MYGTHHTDEWKQNMSKKMSKKVRCIETGQVFNSQKEAAQWCGLANSNSISGHLHGAKKSAGKMPGTNTPLHWEFVQD